MDALICIILILDYQLSLYKKSINLWTSTWSPSANLQGEKVMELIYISSCWGCFLGLVWKRAGEPRFRCQSSGAALGFSHWTHCLGWQESVSLQYHVGGLDLISGAVFSFPQAGRGWEHCTDSTACICNGLHSTFPSLGCTKAAYEIAQTEDWSLEV